MNRRALAELEYQKKHARRISVRRYSVVTVATLLTVTALFAIAADRLFRPGAFPVASIELEGEFKRVDPSRLREAITERAQGNFFAIDLKGIENAAQRVPWVRQATVRRVWPRGIRVKVSEQNPVARWGDDALLNDAGDVIRFSGTDSNQSFVLLNGPDQTGKLVLERYRKWTELLHQIDLDVTKVELSPRFAWSITVRPNDGTSTSQIGTGSFDLVLGTQNADLRLARFIHSFPVSLTPDVARIQRVDLRYTNGYAVSWRPQATQTNDAL